MESPKKRLVTLVGLGVPAFLPYSIPLTNFCLIAFLVLTLATTDRSVLKDNISSAKLKILLNIAPFLFCCLSLLYTSSLADGLFSIEKYFPLLLLPIIFFLGDLSSLDKRQFLLTFSVSVFVLCLVSFSYNSYNYFILHEASPFVGDDYNHVISNWNAFADKNLVRPFDISPIYLSLYISFSMIVFYHYYSRAVFIPIQLFLLIYIILLGSRMGLIAFFTTVLILIFRTLKKPHKYYGIAFTSALIVLLITFNPVLRKRYVEDFKINLPSDVSEWNAVNLRLSIWKCSIESFLKKPIMGYGAGGQWSARDTCYQSYSWYGHFGDINLNSHNQYLEYLLIGGFILTILFVIQLVYSSIQAFTNNDILHVAFLMVFMIVCLGESLLERHMGIVFFSLFNSLFLASKERTTK